MPKKTQGRRAQDRPLSARGAALSLMRLVAEDGKSLSEASDKVLVDLDPQVRARALRLATETLRWAGRCDHVLGPFLRQKPEPAAHAILRMGTYEMLADGQAPHGVVNEAVSLARDANPRVAGLVNAVLRRISVADCDWDSLPIPRLPKWLRKRLVQAFGKETVGDIELAHAKGAPLDLTAKDGAGAALAMATGGSSLPGGTVRLPERAQVSSLPGFEAGDWWVQDFAAAIPARVLAPRRGERVLDLCAAPGGKTLQLAEAGAQVTALDISETRVGRLRENLDRTGLEAEIVIADATDWDPAMPFDAVLLDAPCSATGTIRRHPELPLVRSDDDIDELVALQRTLLSKAWQWIVPGGRLVYSTCSLLPEEGEEQVAFAVEQLEATVLPPDAAAFGLDPDWIDPSGGLRLRPDFWTECGGMDGFYVACLQKTAETPA